MVESRISICGPAKPEMTNLARADDGLCMGTTIRLCLFYKVFLVHEWCVGQYGHMASLGD